MMETIFRITETHQGFEVVFHELFSKKSEKIFEDNRVEVYTIPLDHRIYCNGYLFREKPKERHLNMKEIAKYPEIEIELNFGIFLLVYSKISAIIFIDGVGG